MADLTRAQVRILIQEAEGLIGLVEQAEVKLEAMRLQAQSAAEGAVSARVEDMLIEVRVDEMSARKKRMASFEGEQSKPKGDDQA